MAPALLWPAQLFVQPPVLASRSVFSLAGPVADGMGHQGSRKVPEPQYSAAEAAPPPAANSPPPAAAERKGLLPITGGWWTAGQARWHSLLGSVAALHPSLPPAVDSAAGEEVHPAMSFSIWLFFVHSSLP